MKQRVFNDIKVDIMTSITSSIQTDSKYRCYQTRIEIATAAARSLLISLVSFRNWRWCGCGEVSRRMDMMRRGASAHCGSENLPPRHTLGYHSPFLPLIPCYYLGPSTNPLLFVSPCLVDTVGSFGGCHYGGGLQTSRS